MKTIELASGVSGLSWASTTGSWVTRYSSATRPKLRKFTGGGNATGVAAAAPGEAAAIPAAVARSGLSTSSLPKLGHGSEVEDQRLKASVMQDFGSGTRDQGDGRQGVAVAMIGPFVVNVLVLELGLETPAIGRFRSAKLHDAVAKGLDQVR